MIKIYYNKYYNNIKEKIRKDLFLNIKNNDFLVNFRSFILLFPFIFIISRFFKILLIIL